MSAEGMAMKPWRSGMRDALPLLGGYLPVAISFGLVAVQAGLTPWQAIAISALIYAGASQFVLVSMIAAGSPWWLALTMTLLINLRHIVYAPNLATWLPRSRHWLWLMHGLTDQIFALAQARLPRVAESARIGWFIGAALLAWSSWVIGTALGAYAGEWLMMQWPLLGRVMPFALPALFLVLLVPHCTSRHGAIALGVSVITAMLFTLNELEHIGVPIAALCGLLCYQFNPAGRKISPMRDDNE
ncbi:AzlC family ABC transporter permease [Kushneria phosphatilytica]|uniref:AzlC family ABC transporter permease n=1 Tax=Kushneria phosphatilytica TaxID=657387 RepID=A0A1S1P1T4_9GAMM|nr:AzlC family ABC transporter permease [Kushneria phosphatilytica]OHV12760.1 branched-chain amino acid transporter AzlC [Kushneria phosphatilytica]QEL10601.1 AzlC family ABC transporter permease [Kushneria phosphatilytica]